MPGANSLRQVGSRKGLTEGVAAPVRHLAQPVQQPECMHHGGVDAHPYTVVAGFDALECGARSEGPIGYHLHRQPSSPSRVTEVGAELAEGSPDGGRRMVWRGHSS